MKQNWLKCAGLLALAAALSGCGSSTVIIDENSNEDRVISIDQIGPKEWADAAAAGTRSLLGSNVLVEYRAGHDNVRPRVMVSTVRNKTRQHIDVQLLTDRITEEILGSGQASLTSAMGADYTVDSANKSSRDLENDRDFDQSTVMKRGTLRSANVSLSGAVIEQQVRDGRRREASFFFSMVLTDLSTGEVLWKYNKEIVKQKTESFFGK